MKRWRWGGEGFPCHTSCPWGLSGRVGFGRKREEAEKRGMCVCVCGGGGLLRAAPGATFASQNCNSFQC